MQLKPLHTLPRLYLPQPMAMGTVIRPSAEQEHYLLHVLRCEAGASLRVFNGSQGEWLAQLKITGSGKKAQSHLTVEKQLQLQHSEPDLWLCAAPIRKQHLDFMVMKAVELGISRFQPVLTSRTQVREVNTERLTAIAIEAAEQSERLTIPQIANPQTLLDLAKNWPAGRLPLICAEFGAAHPIQQALSNPDLSLRQPAAIFTGPEGGYTEDEMAILCELPEALLVSLGPRILRADTAALAALAIWQAACGDWQKLRSLT